MRGYALVGFLLVSVSQVWAVDGRWEISQVEMPMVISNPGSYVVTENLSVASGASDGITVQASDVFIDLNGFVLSGPGDGSGDGIAQLATAKNLSVANGTIVNWGDGYGVSAAGDNARIERVTATGNRHGLYGGDYSLINNCIAQSNTSVSTTYGIRAGGYARILDCVSEDNSSAIVYGIFAGLAAHITGCSVSANKGSDTGWGIRAGSDGSLVEGCVVRTTAGTGNNGAAIFGNSGSTIRDNVLRANRNDGIQVTGQCLVEGNQCFGNGSNGDGAGIHATGPQNRIRDNQVLGGRRGLQMDAGDNRVEGNVVMNNASNYLFAAGNHLELLISEIPVTVGWPAVVKLAGTLTGASNHNGIVISADNVTVDLAGHALVGAPGSDDGIVASGVLENLAVVNGGIRNWGGRGIDFDTVHHARITDVIVARNGQSGIYLGDYSIVTRCSAVTNGGSGIAGAERSVFTECLSAGNDGSGIAVGDGSTVKNCTVLNNENTQISTDEGCTVADCTVRGGNGRGIQSNGDGSILHCTVTRNQTGIIVWDDCSVVGNTCSSNGTAISVNSSGTVVDGNLLADNNRGIVSSGAPFGEGSLFVRNMATRNATTNFSFDTFDTYGPVLPKASVITNVNPWANIEF